MIRLHSNQGYITILDVWKYSTLIYKFCHKTKFCPNLGCDRCVPQLLALAAWAKPAREGLVSGELLLNCTKRKQFIYKRGEPYSPSISVKSGYVCGYVCTDTGPELTKPGLLRLKKNLEAVHIQHNRY